MRVFALATAILAFGTVAGAAGASVLLGPEGEFSSLLGRLEYDPSKACSKPFRPILESEYARSSYLADARRYVQCMQDAADADRKYANEVIADGLENSVNDFVSEVERGY